MQEGVATSVQSRAQAVASTRMQGPSCPTDLTTAKATSRKGPMQARELRRSDLAVGFGSQKLLEIRPLA